MSYFGQWSRWMLPVFQKLSSVSVSDPRRGRAHYSPLILHDLGLDLEELGDVEDGREDDDGDDVVHHPPPGVVAL